MKTGSGWLVALAVALPLAPAGCITGDVPIGEDVQPLVVDSPREPSTACEAFCAAAAEVDCPREGDCLAACARDRALKPGCEDELDYFLDCAKSRVRADTCGLSMPMPDEPIEGPHDCLGRLDLWSTCDADVEPDRLLADVCEFWGPPVRCPLGPLILELRDRCHEGECECLLDDQVVATCTSLIAESPLDGCCWPIFRDLLLE